MKQTLSRFLTSKAAAAIYAVLAAWRLPNAFGLEASSDLFASHAFTLVLAAGFYALLSRAFALRDRRLNRIAYLLGAVFALFTVVGEALKRQGELLFTAASALDGAVRPAGEECRVKRVFSSGPFWFFFFLLCWVPVWLSFYPGFFSADNVTQFYEYMDGMFSTHHPLLHTLFLGGLMMLGIDHSADGSAAVGLALYCAVQMVLLAAILAYVCTWMRRRGAPFWLRTAIAACFAVHPFYGSWPFCAQKDVLFAALSLLLATQLVDLYRDGFRLLRHPLRIAVWLVSAVLMMLLRHNGLYAFVLLLPFAVLLARGGRVRVAALMLACLAAYAGVNAALVYHTDAESGSKVEMLSVPLQQLGRTLRENPDALGEDQALVDELYGTDAGMGDIYESHCSDRLKWAIDYDLLDEKLPELLGVWLRTGLKNPVPYLEAVLVQNLPYYAPGSVMGCNLEIELMEPELYPMERQPLFWPELAQVYESYNDTLRLWNLPGTRLMADPAFMVWLCLAALGLAIYRQNRGVTAGCLFLLAVWTTCLLGPIAVIRYVLGLFYAVPVLWAALLGRQEA